MKKTIMVTGATAGFGKAIAIRFADNGYRVIITGRRKDRLAGLEKELTIKYKADVLSLNFDVRNKQSVIGSIISSLPEIGKISTSWLTMPDWQWGWITSMPEIPTTGTG